MRPLLRDGDIIPVFPVEPSSVGPGDVVLYRNGAAQHLHRVWWRRGETLWIKDDTASVCLQEVPAALVLGRCREKGPLSRGRIGLTYSLLCSAIFLVGRAVKTRLHYQR